MAVVRLWLRFHFWGNLSHRSRSLWLRSRDIENPIILEIHFVRPAPGLVQLPSRWGEKTIGALKASEVAQMLGVGLGIRFVASPAIDKLLY
ncbi:hypothetical protein RB6908 [Rhodopirellula baltica SH 1]|uniref:Uncharacterized protein n=1 Tax=Rhodopirellula baltica (strain DSM 10527 / NCIMB 13988 / SH1) TaxID=243090 RepID=Q7UPJ0_RHOBA|nr:hypothetical protein RB6908 [Rhodopirellula baltica SH 1]